MGLREDRLFAWEMGVLRRKGLQAAAAHKTVTGCVGLSSVNHGVTAATTATRQLGARPREVPVNKPVIGFMFLAGVHARRRAAAAAARWRQPASCGCKHSRRGVNQEALHPLTAACPVLKQGGGAAQTAGGDAAGPPGAAQALRRRLAQVRRCDRDAARHDCGGVGGDAGGRRRLRRHAGEDRGT